MIVGSTLLIERKVVLIGEDNPYSNDPRLALFPRPPGSAGARLREMIGVDEMTYLRKFQRVNLCGGKWSLHDARGRAQELAVGELRRGKLRTFVLLGSKVCGVFGVQPEWFTILPEIPAAVPRMIVLPNPSGRNRIWNVPGNWEKVRETFLRAELI